MEFTEEQTKSFKEAGYVFVEDLFKERDDSVFCLFII